MAEPAENVVTNDTFFYYFDGTGALLDNVTSDELIFEGDFSDVGVNYIIIDTPIKVLTSSNNVKSSIFLFLSVLAQNLGKIRKIYAKKQTKGNKIAKSQQFGRFDFENRNI